MDKNDEKIVEYLVHHKSTLWTGILVIGGGVVGLVLTYNISISPYAFNNIMRVLFGSVGVVFLVAMLIGLLNTDLSILNILKKGKKHD